MTSSINAGINQTFSVTLLVTMIHFVVTEALSFNIFTRALYEIMQRDILFYFKCFINPTRGIQANISGQEQQLATAAARQQQPVGEGFDTWPMDYSVVIWLVPRGTAAVSAHVLCTPCNHALIVTLNAKPYKQDACVPNFNLP